MPAISNRPAVTVCEECQSPFVVPWQSGPPPRLCGRECRLAREARLRRESYRRRYVESVESVSRVGGVENGGPRPSTD